MSNDRLSHGDPVQDMGLSVSDLCDNHERVQKPVAAPESFKGTPEEGRTMTTRQWKWMQGRRERGLCEQCGEYSGEMRLCPDCYEHSIKLQRKRRHNKPWEPGHRGRPPKIACDVRKHLREHLRETAQAIVLAVLMYAGIVLAHCM